MYLMKNYIPTLFNYIIRIIHLNITPIFHNIINSFLFVIDILILGYDLGAYSWMKQIIDILLVKF